MALMRKPISGKRGINASTIAPFPTIRTFRTSRTIRTFRTSRTTSPFQRRERVGIERFAMPEERDDQRQPHRRFRRGHGHDEERDDLPIDVPAIASKRHEREVHGVQHDFDRQQNRDQIAPQEHAGGANGEQNRRDDEVVAQRNHDSPSRRARTTAPTIATRISTDVASKANACRSNNTLPSSRTLLTVAGPVCDPTGASSSATRISA